MIRDVHRPEVTVETILTQRIYAKDMIIEAEPPVEFVKAMEWRGMRAEEEQQLDRAKTDRE